MKIVSTVKDKLKRRSERNSSLGYQLVFSDSISFVNSSDWDQIAQDNTIFLSRKYLDAIENCAPKNTSQKYAIAYDNKVPVVIVACQVAEISGEKLFQQSDGIKNTLTKKYKEKILVCGNLVSSGLHGVAFAKDFDTETGWRILAEILYKIRRAEKLTGEVGFVLIKDIKGTEIEKSEVIERFSFRRVQTDPDMVLDLEEHVSSFDDYLKCLSSKYRSRVKKVIKTIDDAHFKTEKLIITKDNDKYLHQLYLEVEKRSSVRLATLPEGHFFQLQKNLGNNFSCFSIKKDEEIIAFISTIKDGDDAMGYYLGINYQINENYPLYFRLLQLVVQSAIDMNCKSIKFGRTALEPKANLGAKPVDAFVWARHRVPIVNFVIRKLFRNIPFDEAPERSATKDKKKLPTQTSDSHD